jgi:hypothetical protein
MRGRFELSTPKNVPKMNWTGIQKKVALFHYLSPSSPCPSASVTDLSGIKFTVWTPRGHHKSGPPAHRAITGEQAGSGRVSNRGLHLCGSRREVLFSWMNVTWCILRGRSVCPFPGHSSLDSSGARAGGSGRGRYLRKVPRHRR